MLWLYIQNIKSVAFLIHLEELYVLGAPDKSLFRSDNDKECRKPSITGGVATLSFNCFVLCSFRPSPTWHPRQVSGFSQGLSNYTQLVAGLLHILSDLPDLYPPCRAAALSGLFASHCRWIFLTRRNALFRAVGPAELVSSICHH